MNQELVKVFNKLVDDESVEVKKKAYRKVAENLGHLSRNLSDMSDEEIKGIKGVGPTSFRVIKNYMKNGQVVKDKVNVESGEPNPQNKEIYDLFMKLSEKHKEDKPSSAETYKKTADLLYRLPKKYSDYEDIQEISGIGKVSARIIKLHIQGKDDVLEKF